MSSDDLDNIPSIVPTREGATPRAGSERRRTITRQERASVPGGGLGNFSYVLGAIALIAAGLSFGYAWQLQAQLDEAALELDDFASRVSDLEARLSDTDEGMNQNASVQAVKIAELESEVRKLWDNVWKQTRSRLDKLEADSSAQGKKVRSLATASASARTELEQAKVNLAELKSVGDDLARVMSSAKTSQAEVERVADSLNQINLTLAKLEKRVAGNEEWVGSVNAFRRQVNASLGELQSSVRTLQTSRP